MHENTARPGLYSIESIQKHKTDRFILGGSSTPLLRKMCLLIGNYWSTTGAGHPLGKLAPPSLNTSFGVATVYLPRYPVLHTEFLAYISYWENFCRKSVRHQTLWGDGVCMFLINCLIISFYKIISRFRIRKWIINLFPLPDNEVGWRCVGMGC